MVLQGTEGVSVTFDLCSPVISFSSSANLKVFLSLQKEKKTRKQKRKSVIMESVCGGVDQEHRQAACGGRTSQSRQCVLSL